MATVRQIIDLVDVLQYDYGYTVSNYGNYDIVIKRNGLSTEDLEDDMYDIVNGNYGYNDLDGDYLVSYYRKQLKIEFY